MAETKGSRQAKGISRAQFLAGAATVGAAGVAGPAGQARAAQARRGRGLRRRGVVSTVGAGKTPGTAWSARRMRHDIRAIREDLHADTVDVMGDGVERLTKTAVEAAERGLHVWLQPTLGDAPRRDILEHIAETGRFAERLRRQGARVDFSVGCEFWLFVPGILPGETVLERIDNLQHGTVDRPGMQRRLAEFTVRAAKVGRSVFRGNLGYAAAQSIDAREFISADAPHRPDEPRLDLDMASYALTKVIRDRRPDDPPPAGTGSRRRRSARWPADMGRRATAPLSRRRGRRRAVRRWPGNGRRPGRRRRCRWPDRRHGRWSSR